MAGSRIQYSTDNAKPAANSGNLLKKPLNGGTPVIASAATQKPTPGNGRVCNTPRRRGNKRVPQL